MKKNTKPNNAQWLSWVQSPDSLKKVFIFVTLVILLVLSIFILWKRYVEKEISQPISLIQTSSTLPATQLLEKPLSPPQEELKLFSDRLTALENRMNQQQEILLTPPKLVVVEVLRAILEGWIPVETLTVFLQRNSAPWAQGLLVTLNPIKESKTYSQLEALLSVSSSQPLSLWERVKRKIKSLIRIRKLDAKGDYQGARIEDVQKALSDHDIAKAMDFFEKLSPQEKTELSSWKILAQNRLTLEIIIKKLIIELTEG